ncbi:general secretion pathway protein I [Geothermobacter ehrlichii]|uniref:General secretion pathway protein I n=1 Tax=Geothermobacter ehrlichii TaxID=213224 RepID=A0A5D3WI83_9BACT|nr:prepilin-type N-terminal cleavage/methylation domain-containing protein [Geothermobacter ehrlichii]TYO97560.1 general secretion pathway protein I [Geothermobacter ehrlichii]
MAKDGFTLLEIMIALAIVAIALVSLLGLMQRSILASDQAQRITRATLLAEEKLARIEAGIDSIDRLEGPFDAPDSGYRWKIALQPAPVPGVRQLELTVAWGDETRNEAVRMVSFVREAQLP